MATQQTTGRPGSFGRAVVLAIGSAGDVAPLAAVAGKLAWRGVDTTLMAPSRYQGLCPMGVMFRSIGADTVFEEVFSSSQLWTARHGLSHAWRAYGAAAQSGYQQLMANWSPRDTVLVSSSFAIAARLAEEAAGFRNTTVHLSPAVLFSHRRPPRWPAASIPEGWPTWAQVAAAKAAETLAVEPVIRRAMAPAFELAQLLPQERLFSRFLHSPHRVAYLFPEWFAAAAEDWPQAGIHVGFPRTPPLVAHGTDAAERFVASNDGALAVVTAGTAVAQAPPWVERSILALTDAGARVLVLGAATAERSGTSNDRVLWTPSVHLATVLPRADLFIHHGGIGSAVEAMRSGTPQWLFPTAHDQPDNAARLMALGAASVWKSDASIAQLTSAWRQRETLVAPMRLAALRTLLATEEDGAERVARLVASDLPRVGVAPGTCGAERAAVMA